MSEQSDESEDDISTGTGDFDSDVGNNVSTKDIGNESGTDKATSQIAGLKLIFMLPYHPVWTNFVLLVGFASVCVTIFNTGYNSYVNKDTIVYPELNKVIVLADVIYLINMFLSIGALFSSDIQAYAAYADDNIKMWSILTDATSLIPVDEFVLILPSIAYKGKLYYIVKLIVCCRLARIFKTFIKWNTKVKHNEEPLLILEYVLLMFLMITIGASVTYVITCYNEVCQRSSIEATLKQNFFDSFCKLTGKGAANYNLYVAWIVIFNVLSLISYTCVECLLMSLMVIDTLVSYYITYMFIKRYKDMTEELNRLHIRKGLQMRCLQYFERFCKKGRRYDNSTEHLSVLSPVMIQEMSLDLNWLALKHSRIFRDMALPFLLHLSQYMKSQVMNSGDVLFEKDQLKSCMIYINSGVVQIMSEEDGQSPILSFSGGTCLGEINLLMGCRNNTMVRCTTFCSVQILERTDLVRMCKIFPKDFRRLLNTLKIRLSRAKMYNRRNKNFNPDLGETKEQMTMMWLKSTLHRLMGGGIYASNRHECQNVFLRREFNPDRFKRKQFCYENLDMLAISERLELITDTVFITKSFPCILQPHSLVIRAWDSIILILALYISIITPFFAFVEHNTKDFYSSSIYIITVFWWIDVYVQISTAVKSESGIIASVKGIIFYKILKPSFLADLVAAFPTEGLSVLCLSTLTRQSRAVLQLNRVIKVWRFIAALRRWEFTYQNFSIFIHYFKYFCIISYSIFIGACFLYAANCFGGTCMTNIRASKGEAFLWEILSASQIITASSVGVNNVYFGTYYRVVALLIISSIFIHLYLNGKILGSYVLSYLDLICAKKHCKEIARSVKANHIDQQYADRLLNFFDTQWSYNHAIKILYNQMVFSMIPLHTYSGLKEQLYKELFLMVPLFQGFPEEMLLQLSIKVGESTLLPPNEVICYAGESIDVFYIIIQGCCKRISKVPGIDETLLHSKETISMLETFLGLPTVNTVITVTHCKLLVVRYPRLTRVYTEFNMFTGEINKALKKANILSQLKMILMKRSTSIRYRPPKLKDNLKSFYKFGYRLQTDSILEYNYFVPFDRLQYWSWLQYVLLRYTIIPEGSFFILWETIRCICGVLSGIVYSLHYTSSCENCVWQHVCSFLDVMAWIDIYLRFHVCYYNDKGILVYHPLKTAVHYFNHSMALDVLAVFPFNWFFSSKDIQENLLYVLLKLNRTLQIHRLVGFCEYLKEKKMHPTCVFPMVLKYMAYLLVISMSASSILVALECKFGDDIGNNGDEIFASGVECKADTWIQNSIFLKPLTPLRTQLYAVYFAASIVTAVGMEGFTISNTADAMCATIMTVFGYIFAMHITGEIIAYYTVRESPFLKQKIAFRAAHNYMAYFKVNRHLQAEVLSHFALKWRKKWGSNILNTIGNYTTILKQDTLFDVYGNVLQRSSIFLDSEPFLRKLLLEVSHDVAQKGSVITVVNDVCKKIYIVLRGSVQVLAPDGTKLATLPWGSMFGNLANVPWARQTISIVASNHMEVLIIDSTVFHKILINYSHLYKRYAFLTAFHADYLENTASDIDEYRIYRDSRYSNKWQVQTKLDNLCKYQVLDHKNMYLRIFNLIVVYLAYFDVFFGLYQLILWEFSWPCILFQYVYDFLLIVHSIVKLHTDFKDPSGNNVRDLKSIRQYRVRNKTSFWTKTLSLIPLDIISWFLPGHFFIPVFLSLRLNRLLRIYYIIEFFKYNRQKLNLNFQLVRFGALVSWTAIALHSCTCILLALHCLDLHGMYPDVECKRNHMSSWSKLNMYITYSHFIINAFTFSPRNDFAPQSTALIMFSIAAMIILKMMSTLFFAHIYAVFFVTYYDDVLHIIRLSKIKANLKRERVCYPVFCKIVRYVKLIRAHQKCSNFPVFLEEAPLHLCEMVLNSAFAHLINHHDIFRKCHADFRRQVVACLRSSIFVEDDIICYKGSVDETMYFIYEGTVVAMYENRNKEETVVGTLRSRMSFGVLQGIFQETPYPYSFRCVKTSIIVSLKRSMWIHLINFYPASKVEILERTQDYRQVFV